ncbi:type II toxin-antitoxin system VapC family toxin [soil metagenome]
MTATKLGPIAFVDSSAILALIDRDDATHTAAVDAYHSLVNDGYRLFTTNHVVGETYDLLYATLGNAIARQWLSDVGLSIYITDSLDEEKARERVLASTSSQPMRYTDAISLSVMERLGVAEAFAVDPYFLDNLV